MINVSALTLGQRNPSARFRIRQYMDILQAQDIHVTELFPPISRERDKPLLPSAIQSQASRQSSTMYHLRQAVLSALYLPNAIRTHGYRITWQLRELISGAQIVQRFVSAPLVYDVDDAVWTKDAAAEANNRKIAERAAVVMAGNAYLADWYSQYARDVRIVPTAVDDSLFQPAPAIDGPFTLGWIGSHSNLPYLEMIEPALHRFVSAHPEVRIRVICNLPPNFTRLTDANVDFIPWSPQVEVSGIQRMNIGLMPLEDNRWARGKCSFKMLQYMSCAVPAVASPVGMNADVLKMDRVGIAADTQDEWYEAFEHYYRDCDAAHADGLSGRAVIEQHFSKRIVAEKIAGIFRELA